MNQSSLHIYQNGTPVAILPEGREARTWHVGEDGLRVYQAGVCVATIPRAQLGELIYQAAQALR